MTLTAPPDQRRQREIRQTREAILLAAATTFAQKGFRGTTMSDIAKAAGYTPPTLYSYFKSKSEIFSALNEMLIDEIVATFEEPVPRGLTFEQKLQLLIHRQLEVAERRLAAFAVFLAVRPLEESSPARGARSGLDYCAGRLAAWIRDSSTEAERGEWDPQDLAWALAGMMNAFIRRALGRNRPAKLAREASLLVELFLDGMRGTASSAAAGTARQSRIAG